MSHPPSLGRRSRDPRVAATERQRAGSGLGLYLGLVTSKHVATDRAHRQDPWANALAGIRPVPSYLEPERPQPSHLRPAPALEPRSRPTWRREHTGYTPRDFFNDDDDGVDVGPIINSPPAASPAQPLEPSEVSSLWLTGSLQPHPPAVARLPRSEGAKEPPPAGQASRVANGRRQAHRQPHSTAHDSSGSSSRPLAEEGRDLSRRVNKAIAIIRAVLRSWEGSMRQTFQRVDTNRSGTIDAEEFDAFLRLKLHMNFDSATLTEIMGRFADRNTGEITYQSFCELVLGEQSERLHSHKQMLQHAAEDADRDPEMMLRNRVRRSGNQLREIFDDLDRTGQGALSYDDLRFALHMFGIVMPTPQFDQLVRKIDANNDQVLTARLYATLAQSFLTVI